jgi:putative aldouronate transport system substrate-binding protein
LEDVPELLPWLAAPDGHIYHLSKWGSYAPYGIAGATHLVRHDIFESYNIEQKWDTYDDFYATLKALKQAEPKYYPWGTRGFPRIIQAMQFGFGTGWGGGWSGLYYDDISDSWKFCTNDPGFKELITFLTKAYAEGILHPEVPTMNSNQFLEHWVDATYRGLALNSGDTFTWESSYLYGENPSNLGKDVRWINPPVSSVPGSRSLYQKGMIDCWSTDVGHVITKKAERPEVLARWLDYMYSEEGQFFHSWGKEGVTFKWFEHPKYGRIPVPFKAEPKETWTDPEFYSAQVSLLQHDAGFGDWGVNIRSDKYQAGPPYCGELKGQVQYRAIPYTRDPAPRVMIDEFANEVAANKRGDLQKYMQEAIISFVMGKKPLSEWDDFLSEIKARDVDLVVDIYNKAHVKTQEIVAGLK